jgi:hypothetical protein
VLKLVREDYWQIAPLSGFIRPALFDAADLATPFDRGSYPSGGDVVEGRGPLPVLCIKGHRDYYDRGGTASGRGRFPRRSSGDVGVDGRQLSSQVGAPGRIVERLVSIRGESVVRGVGENPARTALLEQAVRPRGGVALGAADESGGCLRLSPDPVSPVLSSGLATWRYRGGWELPSSTCPADYRFDVWPTHRASYCLGDNPAHRYRRPQLAVCRHAPCDTKRMTAAPPTDDEIIAALRSLHERFLAAASSEPLVTVDSFLHYGETDANVTALLQRDPVIDGYLALEQPMLNVPGGGTGYDIPCGHRRVPAKGSGRRVCI